MDFLDQHPFSFTPLIQRSLEFSVSYVFTEVGEGVTFERFIVQCMNLIKMIVKNYAYKPSKNFEGNALLAAFSPHYFKCEVIAIFIYLKFIYLSVNVAWT